MFFAWTVRFFGQFFHPLILRATYFIASKKDQHPECKNVACFEWLNLQV